MNTNIENLIQLVRKHPIGVDSKHLCSDALLRTVLQRTYKNLVLAEFSETFDDEKQYFIKALVLALQYGVAFQRNYQSGPFDFLKVSRNAQYLSMSDSIFSLLRLHREGFSHEIIDCCFSRLVNKLSTFAETTFAEIKGFNMEASVTEYFRNGSNSALSESANID